MNRFIRGQSMPFLKAWTLLTSLIMQISCNSATEFTAIAKKDSSLDQESGNIQRTFPAAELRSSTVKWTPEDNKLVETVDLQKKPALTLTYTQNERPLHELEATQGYDGRDNTEQFALWQAGVLDLLIVMDNSGTMAPYQEKVAQRLEPLLENIKNTNWRIAVVTTDSPCVKGVISRADYDSNKTATEAAFKTAIRVGTNGSTVERGIEMAIKGFAPQTFCSGNPVKWTRDAAKTAVIIVTDEANCGSASNEGCNATTHYNYFGPSDFAAQAPAGTRFFGLLHEEANPLCENSAGYETQPVDYYNLASSTGGLWRPICQDDYAAVLGEISRNVGSTLTREFDLAATPTSNSLKVFIDNQQMNSGWSLTGKKVTLVGNETAATNVEFRYNHGALDRFTTLQLSGAFDPASVKVELNGAKMSSSDFQVNASTGALSFARVPADYSRVHVSYREPGVLQSEFASPNNILSKSIEVLVNDQKADNFDFDIESNKVTFAEAPEDGAEIVVKGRRMADYTLDYQLRTGDMSGMATISVVNPDGDLVEAVVDAGVMSLPYETVQQISQVKVIYTLNPDPDSFVITLPQEPVAESLVLTGGAEAQKCLASAPREGRTIKADCLVGQTEQVVVDFSYVIRRFSEFTVELPSGRRVVEWSVHVDGEVVPFTREKTTFRIDPKYLKDTSSVVIDGRYADVASLD